MGEILYYFLGIAVVAVVVFAIVFISKKKANAKQTTHTASKQSGSTAPSKPAVPEHDYNPNGKSLAWFTSPDGIAAYKNTFTIKNINADESFRKKYDDYKKGESYPLDYRVWLGIYGKDLVNNCPSLYVDALIDSLNPKGDVFDYVGPNNAARAKLLEYCKPFELNEDGDPEPKEPLLAPEDFGNPDKNVLLKFISDFEVFKLGDESTGTWETKYKLWIRSFLVVAAVGPLNPDVINEPWLFDKSTYINDMDTVRTEKSYVKTAISKCVNEQIKRFLEKQLEDMN